MFLLLNVFVMNIKKETINCLFTSHSPDLGLKNSSYTNYKGSVYSPWKLSSLLFFKIEIAPKAKLIFIL